MTDDTHAKLDNLLRSANIRLGRIQRNRLAWPVDRYGAPTLGGHYEGLRHGGVIVLTEPPSGAAAELFYRSLHSGCAVVIPFGENPGFDFLKSKLTEFGTVSPSAEGPHELWWGGIGWSKLSASADGATIRPRIVSYYPFGSDPDDIRSLRRSLDELELDSHIEPVAAELGEQVLCFEKAEFLARMWQRYSEPLLFVEAGATLCEAPLLPSALGCDVALHKWNRWEMSARTLYLGRTARAGQLLRSWHHLAASYPSIWDGYLLDQAWGLTSSEGPLDTVWLPRSYHAMKGDLAAARATILHSEQTTTTSLGPDPGFAGLVRAARRAGRTGARDAFMVMTSEAANENGVAVILRDIEANDARAVAATVEAVTGAFAADCGGYKRFELSLCALKDDLGAAQAAAQQARYRILEIAPGQSIPRDFFAAHAHHPADHAVMTARHPFP